MDLNDEIAIVAYEIFVRDGREHGKDKEHWCEAEGIVKARHAAKEKKAEPRKAAPAPEPVKRASGKTPSGKEKETPKDTTPSGAVRAKKTVVKERAK